MVCTIARVLFIECSPYLCVSFKIVNYGGRRGNAVQALARWRHLVASCEARGVLHWAMHPTSHRCICMAIKIASNLPTFFIVADNSHEQLVITMYHSC